LLLSPDAGYLLHSGTGDFTATNLDKPRKWIWKNEFWKTVLVASP